MSQVLNPQNINLKNVKPSGNNNSLAFGQTIKNPNQKSFKDELAYVKTRNQAERENPAGLENLNQEIYSQNTATTVRPHIAANVSQAISEALTKKEEENKFIKDRETIKEIRDDINEADTKKDSVELKEKFTVSDNQAANSSQLNHKQITEAIREGNVAQQEYQQSNGNDRKKQLANWEDLAPKIMEDPINKAVRIDIPGLNDIETLIVRMQQDGAVAIQVVGSKDSMSVIKSSERELVRRLQAQNIKLDNLQAFDSAILAKAKSKRVG